MLLTVDTFSMLPALRHGFFTREGGVSRGIFASLNCAYGTGDDPAHVRENWGRVSDALAIAPLHIAKAHQVHSAVAVIAAAPWAHGQAPQADAVVTATPGLAVAVTTADCAPVLLADGEARVVAAVHAGWKGALNGVLEAAIAAMESLGARRGRIAASVGPCIAQASYEVGPEFAAAFLAADTANGGFFMASSRPGHRMFDLSGYVRHRLARAGVGAINLLARDTCSEENAFFSYRRACLRGERHYGCQMSAIVLDKK